MRAHSLACIAMVGIALSACSKGKAWEDREVDHSLIRIAGDKLHLRHDTVGHDQWQSRATFALVDAYNDHSEPLMVTLGGHLIGADGAEVSKVRSESLRIPPGGVRTFALIDRQQAVQERAVSARIEVFGAYVPNYPPLVQVTDGKVHRYDSERIVVNGVVRNAVDKRVKVIVLAGFYDADDRPLTRPFTEMSLGGNADANAQFAGPPGAVKGYIFIGDMVY